MKNRSFRLVNNARLLFATNADINRPSIEYSLANVEKNLAIFKIYGKIIFLEFPSFKKYRIF